LACTVPIDFAFPPASLDGIIGDPRFTQGPLVELANSFITHISQALLQREYQSLLHTGRSQSAEIAALASFGLCVPPFELPTASHHWEAPVNLDGTRVMITLTESEQLVNLSDYMRENDHYQYYAWIPEEAPCPDRRTGLLTHSSIRDSSSTDMWSAVAFYLRVKAYLTENRIFTEYKALYTDFYDYSDDIGSSATTEVKWFWLSVSGMASVILCNSVRCAPIAFLITFSSVYSV